MVYSIQKGGREGSRILSNNRAIDHAGGRGGMKKDRFVHNNLDVNGNNL